MNLHGKIKLFTKTARRNFYDIFFGMNEILEVVNKHILITEGEIYEISIEEKKDEKTIAVNVKAKMEIVNNCEILLTLINPKYFEQSDVKFFATTKEDCDGRYNNIYSSPYPKDWTANKNVPKLVHLFNENRVPENVAISLEPQEKFGWNEEIYFEFQTRDTKRQWQGISWKEFRNNGSSFWFRFDYRLPEAMSALKPKLFEIFPDDWKTAGEIPIARYQIKDISGQKMSLATKPIFIDFTRAKVKETKDNDERKFA